MTLDQIGNRLVQASHEVPAGTFEELMALLVVPVGELERGRK